MHNIMYIFLLFVFFSVMILQISRTINIKNITHDFKKTIVMCTLFANTCYTLYMMLFHATLTSLSYVSIVSQFLLKSPPAVYYMHLYLEILLNYIVGIFFLLPLANTKKQHEDLETLYDKLHDVFCLLTVANCIYLSSYYTLEIIMLTGALNFGLLITLMVNKPTFVINNPTSPRVMEDLFMYFITLNVPVYLSIIRF